MKKILQKTKQFLVSVSVLSVMFLSIPAGTALAQQVTMSVSPPLVQTLIKPGKTILIAYTFQNLGDPVPVKIHVRSFIPHNALGEQYIKDSIEGPVRFTLDNTDLVFDEPFLMKSGSSRQALLRIRIPEGAPEGDYYYTILAEAQPPAAADASVSQARTSIGSNILITVSETGRTEVKAHVSEFTIRAPLSFRIGNTLYRIFDSADPVPVTLTIANDGRNLVQPQGALVLHGMLGDKTSFPVVSQNILAYSERMIRFSSPAAGNSVIPQSGTLRGFFVGSYTLSTNITFGEGTPQLISSVSFIAIPFRYLLGIAAAAIIAMLLILKMKKRGSDEDEP